MESGIILPRPGDERPFKSLYEKWRVEYDKANPAPPIENVRFERDPNWRNRIASIQCAHDCWKIDRPTVGSWFWRGVSILFYVAQTAVPFAWYWWR